MLERSNRLPEQAPTPAEGEQLVGDMMRRLTFIGLVLVMFACSYGVSNGYLAKQCGVDETELNAGFDEVNGLAPDEERTVGRCTLKKSEDQKRILVDFN